MTSVPDTRQIAVLPHSSDPETWLRDKEANASESSMGDARGVNPDCVDSRGLGHSPEKRKVGGSTPPLTTNNL